MPDGRDWEQQVREVLEAAGCTVWQTHDSRRCPVGEPDLRAVTRHGRLLCLECKSGTGRLTGAQRAGLVALRRVPGVIAEVVRPGDLPLIRQWATGGEYAARPLDEERPEDPTERRVRELVSLGIGEHAARLTAERERRA